MSTKKLSFISTILKLRHNKLPASATYNFRLYSSLAHLIVILCLSITYKCISHRITNLIVRPRWIW